MSRYLVAWMFRHVPDSLDPLALLVALKLADRADPFGNVRLSTDDVADDCHVDRRTARRHLKVLHDAKVVLAAEEEARGGRTHVTPRQIQIRWCQPKPCELCRHLKREQRQWERENGSPDDPFTAEKGVTYKTPFRDGQDDGQAPPDRGEAGQAGRKTGHVVTPLRTTGGTAPGSREDTPDADGEDHAATTAGGRGPSDGSAARGAATATASLLTASGRGAAVARIPATEAEIGRGPPAFEAALFDPLTLDRTQGDEMGSNGETHEQTTLAADGGPGPQGEEHDLEPARAGTAATGGAVGGSRQDHPDDGDHGRSLYRGGVYAQPGGGVRTVELELDVWEEAPLPAEPLDQAGEPELVTVVRTVGLDVVLTESAA